MISLNVNVEGSLGGRRVKKKRSIKIPIKGLGIVSSRNHVIL